MNIALSTLLIFLFLLPGLIFRKLYYSGTFSKQYFKQNFFELFISSFVPAIIFQFTWFTVVEFFDYYIDLMVLVKIFDEDKISNAFTNFENYKFQIFFYHLSLNIFAGLMGWLLKFLVRKTKADKRIKILRYRNSWHYLFSGEFFDLPMASFNLIDDDVNQIEFIYTDVLTSASDKLILYEGILVDYELSKDEGLNYLILKEYRRRFIDDNEKDNKEYYEIPGHILIIPYSSITNINMSFYKLNEISEDKYQIVPVK